eukprot:m.310431 g.310431  ORF g.310431 m.310431 type:complete len:198 (-) comp16476_c2_seq12:40-633(-)
MYAAYYCSVRCYYMVVLSLLLNRFSQVANDLPAVDTTFSKILRISVQVSNEGGESNTSCHKTATQATVEHILKILGFVVQQEGEEGTTYKSVQPGLDGVFLELGDSHEHSVNVKIYAENKYRSAVHLAEQALKSNLPALYKVSTIPAESATVVSAVVKELQETRRALDESQTMEEYSKRIEQIQLLTDHKLSGILDE